MNRIPRRVPLGAEIMVQVRMALPSVISGIVGKAKAGAWDLENKTIWIDKTLSAQRKWKTYRHELKHALVDIHDEENGGI